MNVLRQLRIVPPLFLALSLSLSIRLENRIMNLLPSHLSHSTPTHSLCSVRSRSLRFRVIYSSGEYDAQIIYPRNESDTAEM